MAFKATALIALFMLFAGLRRTTSKSLQKACQTHMDCKKAHPICDGGLCREIQSVPEIAKFILASCRDIFKAPCKVDATCSCTSIQMICESNECVVRRNSNASEGKK